ncbi:hypothetical protein AFLA70_106g003710 [Aspergillus flavus AF70]|nr:hypothetical protein AFLA70_106g003710 [Aspergillus flavus AF70]
MRSLLLDLLISSNAKSEGSRMTHFYTEFVKFLGFSLGLCWNSPGAVNYSIADKEVNPAGDILLDNDIHFCNRGRDRHILVGLGSREHIRNLVSQSRAKGRFRLRLGLKGYSEDKLLAI